MINELYESVDKLATITIYTGSRYNVFSKLVSQFPDFQEVLDNGDLEILPLNNEQQQLVDKINQAAVRVFGKYGITAKPTIQSIQIYRINGKKAFYDDELTEKGLDQQVDYEEYGDMPHSFIDPNTSLIYLRDIDLFNSEGKFLELSATIKRIPLFMKNLSFNNSSKVFLAAS